MPRRASAPILLLSALLLLSLVPLTAAATELGPPARNVETFREDDAGYFSFGYSVDKVDMKERVANPWTAPGVREVRREVTYVGFSMLPSDRVELDLRFGIQGMRVGNALLVEGQTIDGAARLAGYVGGGLRFLAYENVDSGFRVGILADGDATVVRWNDQQEFFKNASDNDVAVDLHYGEYFEGRVALPLSKVFRLLPRAGMDTMAPKELATDGGIDWPWPSVTALEIYGGPFARAAYMYGNVNVKVGGVDQGSQRFHLLQDSVAGAYGGLRCYGGRTHRWSLGLEGRYQSDLSLSLLLNMSM